MSTTTTSPPPTVANGKDKSCSKAHSLEKLSNARKTWLRREDEMDGLATGWTWPMHVAPGIYTIFLSHLWKRFSLLPPFFSLTSIDICWLVKVDHTRPEREENFVFFSLFQDIKKMSGWHHTCQKIREKVIEDLGWWVRFLWKIHTFHTPKVWNIWRIASHEMKGLHDFSLFRCYVLSSRYLLETWREFPWFTSAKILPTHINTCSQDKREGKQNNCTCSTTPPPTNTM